MRQATLFALLPQDLSSHVKQAVSWEERPDGTSTESLLRCNAQTLRDLFPENPGIPLNCSLIQGQ